MDLAAAGSIYGREPSEEAFAIGLFQVECAAVIVEDLSLFSPTTKRAMGRCLRLPPSPVLRCSWPRL